MLHPARLSPQVRQAEADEECTTNKLLKRLMVLKQEKEQLAIEVEREEELLTNKLQRKLRDVRQEKVRGGKAETAACPRRHVCGCSAEAERRLFAWCVRRSRESRYGVLRNSGRG